MKTFKIEYFFFGQYHTVDIEAQSREDANYKLHLEHPGSIVTDIKEL